MYMTNSNDKGGELLGQERRRRWSTDQKLVMVRESLEPGQSVAVVARRNSINAVPASELTDAVKQSRELQRMLGKKTMEAEVFKEAVEIAWSRKCIAHSPLLPGDDQ
jgi:transposase